MPQPILFLTGFEPFLDTPINASGELARALHGSTVAGARIHAVVLPVTFDGMPPAYHAALEALPSAPLALCSLGVQREPYFRLENRARPVLDSHKPDTSGVFASEQAPLGSADRRTTLDLEVLAQAVHTAGGEDVRISEDAGGYVCERCYWEVLGESLARDVPGVFLHVPPITALALNEQLAPVRGFLAELVRQASSGSRRSL